jgi:serine/threonine protein kinase
LGKGSFGSVWSAVHIKVKAPCAVKIVTKKKLKEMKVYQELMMNELKVLEETNHPNIPRVFELFEDHNNYYIITELISGGNMLEKMMELETMSESQVVNVIKQVLLPVNYMHSNRQMTHRDIKLENLLCMPSANRHEPLTVKLTDFGFATYLKMGEELKLPLGSPLYMAPEIIERRPYDHRVDTWAIGVMAYICLTGTPPFYDEKPEKLKDRIC